MKNLHRVSSQSNANHCHGNAFFMKTAIFFAISVFVSLLSLHSNACDSTCEAKFGMITPEMSNQRAEPWSHDFQGFWKAIVLAEKIQPLLEWVPEVLIRKKVTHEGSGQEIELTLLNKVTDGFWQPEQTTYKNKNQHYRNFVINRGQYDWPRSQKVIRAPYRFLHVTKKGVHQLIEDNGLLFSPGKEVIRDETGEDRWTTLGENFFSAFYTTMERSYMEPLGDRLATSAIKSYVENQPLSSDERRQQRIALMSTWWKGDFAPEVLEAKLKPEAMILDMRHHKSIGGQPAPVSIGQQAYGWYLALESDELKAKIRARIGNTLLYNFPLEQNQKLWRSPQTFAHLVGADAVHRKAGMSHGRSLIEVNIINPLMVEKVELKEPQMQREFLCMKSFRESIMMGDDFNAANECPSATAEAFNSSGI